MSKKNTAKNDTKIDFEQNKQMDFERDLHNFFSNEDHIRIRELEMTIVSLSIQNDKLNKLIESLKREESLRTMYRVHDLDFDKEMGRYEDEGDI
jgi:mRNA-degrading endonuclease YafQ of YafQ-DinJ toxin-antitoxin module